MTKEYHLTASLIQPTLFLKIKKKNALKRAQVAQT